MSLKGSAPADVTADTSLDGHVQDLLKEVSELYTHPNLQEKFVQYWSRVCMTEAKVQKGVEDAKCKECTRFYKVEPDYYEWTLEKRMIRLKAPSILHLCKTLIFENTRHVQKSDNFLDRSNSKYYAVIVQYAEKMNTQKIINFVYEQLSGKKIAKKHFNFRMALEDVSFELTGYATGGVTPFGLKNSNIPILVSKSITTLLPKVLFLGAGHPDWKIALPVDSLISSLNCFVVDLS